MAKPKLTPVLKMALLEGPKVCGSYKFPEAIGRYEESLTLAEIDTAEKFLGWIVANKYTYGWGNLQSRFEEWAKAGAR